MADARNSSSEAVEGFLERRVLKQFVLIQFILIDELFLKQKTPSSLLPQPTLQGSISATIIPRLGFLVPPAERGGQNVRDKNASDGFPSERQLCATQRRSVWRNVRLALLEKGKARRQIPAFAHSASKKSRNPTTGSAPAIPAS